MPENFNAVCNHCFRACKHSERSLEMFSDLNMTVLEEPFNLVATGNYMGISMRHQIE